MPDPADDVRRYEEQYRLSGDSIALARLAEAYRKAGDPQRALDLLAEAFPRHAGYAGTHAARARALADQRRREPPPDTRSVWEGVVAAERSRPAPRSEEAGAADDGPDADEEPGDRPGEDSSPEEDEEDLVTRTLAELYVRQGCLEEAAAIYVRLAGKHPDDIAARKGLDRVRARLGGEDGGGADPPGGMRAEAPPAQPATGEAASRVEPFAEPGSRPHGRRFQSIRDQLRALLQ